ncbi:hypothetical protein KC367_g115 [Hortaea werneckii]|nr:hypothetical protein KC367_g115 [Hortaea werneckii]
MPAKYLCICLLSSSRSLWFSGLSFMAFISTALNLISRDRSRPTMQTYLKCPITFLKTLSTIDPIAGFPTYKCWRNGFNAINSEAYSEYW